MDDVLAGRRILVTRAAHQAAALREALAERGAEVIACPVLRIEAAAAAGDLPPLHRYRWLVVTSRNGVQHLQQLIEDAGASWPDAADLRLAVVGPGTAAALADLGRRVDLVADPPTGEGLAAGLAALGLSPGTPVLRVRGDLAPPDIEDALAAAGAAVDTLTAYRTVTASPPADALAALQAGAIHAVTFFSPSAVAGLAPAVAAGDLPARVPAVCVGPVTAEAARQAGWRRVATAARPDAQAVADALVAALAVPR
jgi:uroporphyrinogen-III synthase